MDADGLIKLSLAGYLLVVAFVGVLARRLVRSADDFFRAGGQMPWWTAGISLYMGTFSAFAFVAFGSMAFEHGMSGVLVGAGAVVGWFLSGLLLAVRWRRARLSSPTEYLQHRFGSFARQALVWLNLILSPLQAGLRLFGFAIMVHGILGYPVPEIILVAASVMLIYSTMGGLWAVVLTDTVQFIVIFIGLVPLLILSVIEVGGLPGILNLYADGFFSFTSGSLSAFWLVTWWVTEIVNTLASFQGVQRYSAVPSEKDARKAAYLAAVMLVPTMLLALTPSLLGSHIFPSINGELIFAHMTTSLLPASLVGLMLGALCAATMSSLDSIFNIDASIMTNDVYKRLFRPEASERNLIVASRVFTMVAIILAVSIALAFAASQMGTFGILEFVQSRVLIVLWMHFVLGILFRNIGQRGFVVSLGVCLLASATMAVMEVSTSLSRLLIILVCMVSFLMCGRVFSATAKEDDQATEFFARLKRPEQQLTTPVADGHGRFLQLIGISLVALSVAPALLALASSEQGWARGIEIAVPLFLMILGASCLYSRRNRRDTL